MKKITQLSILFACLSAGSLTAQINRSGVLRTRADVAPSQASSPVMERRAVLPARQQSLGNYSTQWKSADGTVMTQSFTLRKNLQTTQPGNVFSSGSKLKIQVKSTSAEDMGDCFSCTTEEKRVSMSDNTFLTVGYAAQSSNIYPGAIYKFDNYANGSWRAEEAERNPIVLNASVYNVTGRNYEDVPQPSAASIGNAIANLFGRFSVDPNKVTNGSMQFTAYEVESLADVMVKVGASGHGFGYYAKNLFQFNDKEHHRFILIDCTKEMFTINTTAPASGFFSDAARGTGDMMYISSVTYGVRILACMDIATREKTIADKFEGGGNWGVAGGQIDVDAFSREFNTTNTIKMYVVGGRSNEVFPVYNYDDLKKRCAEIAKTTTYNTVLPVKYQLKNLMGDVVTSSSATDYFKVRNCSCKSPGKPEPAIEVTAGVSSMRTLNNNTDAELYGQIWAQAFDGAGREIAPLGGRDRLFSVAQEAHLSADQLRSMYNPQITAKFKIPADRKVGAKLIIFYWLMEYDAIGGDDFLHMQNGYQLTYNNNNTKYYVAEIRLDDVSATGSYSPKTASFTAAGEGVFEITTNVSKKELIQ